MAATKANTTTSLNKPVVSEAELTAEIAKAKAAFNGEKLVKVSIPKILSKGIGPTLFVGVNGVFVNIPVDGKEYEIPETLANHAKDYLANLT